MPNPQTFRERYGEWALVAGAAQGLGYAFAEALSKRQMNVILLDREADLLAQSIDKLQQQFPHLQYKAIHLDLSQPFPANFLENFASRPIGLLVYNAAFAPMGKFAEQTLDTHQQVLQTNCMSAVALIQQLLPLFQHQKRGGIVLISSLIGLQGSAFLANYAASKAYLRVLGQGLWAELQPEGIDVLVSSPGAVATPSFLQQHPHHRFPKPLQPDWVAEQTLQQLGKRPFFIPGRINRWIARLLTHLLPLRLALKSSSQQLYKLWAKRHT